MTESTARNEQAARVWTAMRDLADGYPPKDALRGALNLGRGSGRVKALLWLAEGPLSLSGIAIFLALSYLSHLLLYKWHESALKREN